mgnify:CR=1 FL=1
MYILKPELLVKGDVILCRFDDELSKRVMKSSNSKFSHAMLYWKNSSILESADQGVHSENIQRILFDNQDDVVVLRLKTPESKRKIDSIILNASTFVGTAYSYFEACRTKIKNLEIAQEPNRQFCTRFIAQSFAKSGLEIVANPDYCTPEEVLNSNLFERIEGVLKTPTSKEWKILETASLTESQRIITNDLLEEARHIASEDIQTLEQLCQFLIDHPNYDTELLKSLEGSGYLDLGLEAFVKVPWLFNESAFHDFLQTESSKEQTCRKIVEIAEDSINQFSSLYGTMMKLHQEYRLQYFFRLATHYLMTEQFFKASKQIAEAALVNLNEKFS